jgi:hypothetical protein
MKVMAIGSLNPLRKSSNREPNAAIGDKRATGRSAMLRWSRDDARFREWSFTMLTKIMLAASPAAE